MATKRIKPRRCSSCGEEFTSDDKKRRKCRSCLDRDSGAPQPGPKLPIGMMRRPLREEPIQRIKQ
jgi:hypothetical protein